MRLKRKKKRKENEVAAKLNNIFIFNKIRSLLLFTEDGDHERHKKLWLMVT